MAQMVIVVQAVSATSFTVYSNLATIRILSRGKCGLSRCVTRYLVAMAVVDLLIIIFDLILRRIPIIYQMRFFRELPVCNIHAVLLHAVTDCSVWFTVMFTFDRFVAISCRILKHKYCIERTAKIVLGAVTVLCSLKNIFWYFMYARLYIWTVTEFLHYILTPCVPFVFILMLNALTIRHILVASQARGRLRAQNCPRDPEIQNRRKSVLLLFFISGNFILLWAVITVYSIWSRMWSMGYFTFHLPTFVAGLGFMFQMLSCCTNTCIYAITQTRFRKQLMSVLKYPFSLLVGLNKHRNKIRCDSIIEPH
ncbi:probable G-protein coupled receptor 139 [Narcine bancroftii]|uniref:probable G-protein coupled receptor 139 n=1 Tax=Narcine bancroftii TaxID=1343680 RepID=UPI00383156CA